jgi:hypothetical protein
MILDIVEVSKVKVNGNIDIQVRIWPKHSQKSAADNASSNDILVAELAKILPSFGGETN